MPELKILRNCFASATIVFAFVFATTVPVLLRSALPHATPSFHAEPVGILLIAMRELIVLMPPVIAIVNGLAWWTLATKRPSARYWAIGASASLLGMSLPFFIADLVILPGTVGFFGVLVLGLALSSIGITGLAVFGKLDALAASSHRDHTWDDRAAAVRP